MSAGEALLLTPIYWRLWNGERKCPVPDLSFNSATVRAHPLACDPVALQKDRSTCLGWPPSTPIPEAHAYLFPRSRDPAVSFPAG